MAVRKAQGVQAVKTDTRGAGSKTDTGGVCSETGKMSAGSKANKRVLAVR